MPAFSARKVKVFEDMHGVDDFFGTSAARAEIRFTQFFLFGC